MQWYKKYQKLGHLHASTLAIVPQSTLALQADCESANLAEAMRRGVCVCGGGGGEDLQSVKYPAFPAKCADANRAHIDAAQA